MGHFAKVVGLLIKDKVKDGIEADGTTKSQEYCNNCYQSGKFTEPDITALVMQEKVKLIVKRDMHMPGILVSYFAKNIPNLKRWQQT